MKQKVKCPPVLLECLLFRSCDKNNIPDEDCGICLNSLKESGNYGCSCCRYAKQFEKCNHWVHVGCYFHTRLSENDYFCPICIQNIKVTGS